MTAVCTARRKFGRLPPTRATGSVPIAGFTTPFRPRQRIQLLADRKSFKETHKYLNSVAPISFSQRVSYRNLVSKDQNRTGLTEATVTGACRIEGSRAMLVVLDFGFMGGSMGSVVGEKIALALEAAARQELPLVAVVTGGGARIQEGVLSLMQMAKTVTAANRFKEKGLPFIVVLANPSTGQAYASFANLADVILAEPGSLIGLAPLRALREVSAAPLPLDAHTAEAHLQHGLVDNVVDRESLKSRLALLLRMLGDQRLGKGEYQPPSRSRRMAGPGSGSVAGGGGNPPWRPTHLHLLHTEHAGAVLRISRRPLERGRRVRRYRNRLPV